MFDVQLFKLVVCKKRKPTKFNGAKTFARLLQFCGSRPRETTARVSLRASGWGCGVCFSGLLTLWLCFFSTWSGWSPNVSHGPGLGRLAERALYTRPLVDWQGTPPKGRQVFKGSCFSSPEGTSQEIASGNLRFLKSWACPSHWHSAGHRNGASDLDSGWGAKTRW